MINTKKLLANKYVLYVILFLAVTNVLGYLMSNDINSVVFFVLVGFLTSYFNKNMTVVLLCAMVSTNFFRVTRSYKEGLESKIKADKQEEEEDDNEKEDVEEVEEDVQEKNGNSKKLKGAALDSEDGNWGDDRVDYAATLEKAYENVENIIGKGGVEKFTKDTAGLAKRQGELMSNMSKMAPILEQATNMLEKFDIGKITGMTEKLGGMMEGGKKARGAQ